MTYRPRRAEWPRPCAHCEAPMVSQHDWRKGIRPEGTVAHQARELCIPCYARRARNGTPERKTPKRPPKRGPESWSAEETLEEYIMIRDSVRSVAEAAQRMGVTFAKLDKALYRARKRGDTRGNVPQAQIDRAIQRGATPGYVRSTAA